MLDSINHINHVTETKTDTRKVLIGLTIAFFSIGGLAILQDLAESHRSGYAFYLSESLLFKTIWFLFIPILTFLYQKIKGASLNSLTNTILMIVAPITIHFLLVPFIALIFSLLFFEGRYDLYKFFSYTFAHDFYKLVIVYAGFVLGYKFLKKESKVLSVNQEKETLEKIIINNGRENIIVWVDDILQITSATPYIFIHLTHKKYLHSATLKVMSQQLDSNTFIRVHKSALVNISKIKSFKSRLNGDYDLLLINGDAVRLSRTYTPYFKKYLKMG